MTQPIDTAYVEIKAKGEDDAAREIAKALDKIAAEVKKLTAAIEKEFVQAGHDMEHEVQSATKSIERDLDRQSRAAKSTAGSLALAMKEASASAAASIDDMADEAVNDLERISRQAAQTAAAVAVAGHAGDGGGGSIGGGGGGHGGDGIDIDFGRRNRDLTSLNGALGRLREFASGAIASVKELAGQLSDTLATGAVKAGQAVGGLASTIGSILGPIGSFIAGLGMLGIVLLLSPIIIPLIAALSQLSALFLALPGAIGVLGAAIAPLVIAFQGIGDAVSALASGDLEKIDKAMQNLSPQARKFAVEIFHLRDEMKLLKFTVQDAFFERFNGSLEEMVNRLLPSLRSGLGWVSSNLGKLAADLTDTLSSTKAISTLNDLFATTGRIIDGLRGPLMAVVDSLLGGMKASLPFVERMFKSLGDGMQKFAGWLNAAIEDGRFQEWMENAFDVAKKLWNLLKSVGRLIGAIFGGTADDGKDFLDMLTEMVDKMTEFFSSKEGKQWMQDTIENFKRLTEALIWLIGAASAVGKWLVDVYNSLLSLIQGAKDAWNAVSEFFQGLWDWVQNAAGAVGDWFKSVGQWFSDTWNTVTDKGGQILQWFQDLPGKIGDFIASIPERVRSAFVTAFDNATYAIGFGIGTVVRFFIDLPGRIQTGLTTLWTNVTNWFNRTRTNVVDTVTRMYNSVVDWFTRLPGRVSSAVSSIVDRVTAWFRSTRDRSVSTATSTVNSIISWFSQLPGRAASAISSLPGRIVNILRGIVNSARNIGSDIMNGIADGIRNGVNSAINAAIRAAQNILKGFWDALGIASPSKVMAAKVGKPIMQGIGVGVEDTQPEVARSINNAVNRTVESTSANAGSVASGGDGGSITIQNLTIPITGTLDFTNPATARITAMKIYEILQQLQREYR